MRKYMVIIENKREYGMDNKIKSVRKAQEDKTMYISIHNR